MDKQEHMIAMWFNQFSQLLFEKKRPVSAGEAAKALWLSRSTMTKLLGKMIERNLVEPLPFIHTNGMQATRYKIKED